MTKSLEFLKIEAELLEECDDIIGGYWGNHISWQGQDQFNDINSHEYFSAYGHKPLSQQPETGHKILGEFQRSWIMFEVLEIKRPGNPPDMFFLKLKAIKQVPKPRPEKVA